MPQNDPANNLKGNPKENTSFLLAKSARFGSKKGHQKYILTVEAQSFYAKILTITNNFTSTKLLSISNTTTF
jgi:hypothetical protein